MAQTRTKVQKPQLKNPYRILSLRRTIRDDHFIVIFKYFIDIVDDLVIKKEILEKRKYIKDWDIFPYCFMVLCRKYPTVTLPSLLLNSKTIWRVRPHTSDHRIYSPLCFIWAHISPVRYSSQPAISHELLLLIDTVAACVAGISCYKCTKQRWINFVIIFFCTYCSMV